LFYLGVEEMTQRISTLSEEVLSASSEAFILQIQQKPGWKESNFQVLSSARYTLDIYKKKDAGKVEHSKKQSFTD